MVPSNLLERRMPFIVSSQPDGLSDEQQALQEMRLELLKQWGLEKKYGSKVPDESKTAKIMRELNDIRLIVDDEEPVALKTVPPAESKRTRSKKMKKEKLHAKMFLKAERDRLAAPKPALICRLTLVITTIITGFIIHHR